MTWNPNTWRNYPVVQMPKYINQKSLSSVEAKLSLKPPLVFAGEVQALKKSLHLVEKGEAFILQGGDCAESFTQFSANGIRDTFKVLLQMAVILTFGSSMPIIKIGRIAGQFAKPRSSDIEVLNGVELPSYRGDMINDMEFNKASREPDPHRLIEGYEQSAATLNLIRAFAQGGMADLAKVHEWTLGFLADTPETTKYQEVADRISESLNFMKACGLTSDTASQLRETEFTQVMKRYYLTMKRLLQEKILLLLKRDGIQLQLIYYGLVIELGNMITGILSFCQEYKTP